jgi:RIO-like serine/threonine protein kinase
VTDPNYPKAALWKEIDMHRYITVKLKGSGFLPLREVYQSNHFYYLVCERLKGVPLKHYVNDWQHTVTIIRQLLECVQLMNKHGLIHRDLNPLNVFVEDGSSTIVDFSFTVMAD